MKYPLFSLLTVLIACMGSLSSCDDTQNIELSCQVNEWNIASGQEMKEGALIRLDSPFTACDFLLVSEDTFALHQPVDRYFTTRALLFESQHVLLVHDPASTQRNCTNDDDIKSLSNVQLYEMGKLLIDQETAIETEGAYVLIDSLATIGDYLQVFFQSSGCSGYSWEAELLKPSDAHEENRDLIALTFKLKNEEGCASVIDKSMLFNISELVMPGQTVQLEISHGNQQVKHITYCR